MNRPEHQGFRRVARETMNDRVYEEIRRVVMGGQLQPGSSVTIRGLAEKLGTSTMPVRDALRRLHVERILEVDGQRRFRLRALSRAEFEEILALRLQLEGDLAELAALTISDTDLATLREIQSRIEANLSRDENFLRANQEFHFHLYACAQRPITIEIIGSLWLQVGPLLNYYRQRHGGDVAIQHHRDIIQALQERNPTAVRTAVQADLRDAAAVILEEMPA